MALEQQVMGQQAGPSPEKQAPKEEKLTKDEEDDLAITVMLAENMIDDAGIGVIQEALASSNDPGQVIGEFLMQLVAQMSESMPEQLQFSPRVFFAVGGWVEQISDYLQEQYDVPQDVMDRAEIFIATQASSMANGVAQGQPSPPATPPSPDGQSLEGQVAGGVV